VKIIIVGGGAAGFFAAISAKKHNPKAQVIILEKTTKLLSKVKISGGGRCNVTNACFELGELVKNYPRGSKFLRNVFEKWAVQDTIDWFESRGVQLKTEKDNRIFPITRNSQTIVDCLLQETRKLGIKINTKQEIISIEVQENQSFLLKIKKQESILADKLIIATGGSPKLQRLTFLEELKLKIIPPVPSLFTFNIPKNPIQNLQGISYKNARLKILKTKLKEEGIILITHWGFSGPAVLRLSAWGARVLKEMNYEFDLQVNYLPEYKEVDLREYLFNLKGTLQKRKIQNKNPFEVPNRLWALFLEKSNISKEKIWAEVSKKEINKLINTLQNDTYEVRGKTTFKEEFVTCGGVSLSEINKQTMQSKKIPNLFFAGEVLDIDAITGGFNFQSAWATGFLAGKSATQF